MHEFSPCAPLPLGARGGIGRPVAARSPGRSTHGASRWRVLLELLGCMGVVGASASLRAPAAVMVRCGQTSSLRSSGSCGREPFPSCDAPPLGTSSLRGSFLPQRSRLLTYAGVLAMDSSLLRYGYWVARSLEAKQPPIHLRRLYSGGGVRSAQSASCAWSSLPFRIALPFLPRLRGSTDTRCSLGGQIQVEHRSVACCSSVPPWHCV